MVANEHVVAVEKQISTRAKVQVIFIILRYLIIDKPGVYNFNCLRILTAMPSILKIILVMGYLA